VTVGVFDGVHLGHQHLINHLASLAGTQRGTQITPVIVTFKNHPLTILKPDISLAFLTTLSDRLGLLHQTGIENVLPITFSRDLSLMSAEEFITILIDTVGMTSLIVGPDFAMGRDRLGTGPLLNRLGEQQGFSVHVIPPFSLEGRPVNSTKIREALSHGNVDLAKRLLGRRYKVGGVIERGEGRGKTLGFPTANITHPTDLALPADGIYAANISINHSIHAAAVSIGSKPTFHSNSPRTTEAYILDFDGDLYGYYADIEFVDQIRPQKEFPSADALVKEMEQDILKVRSTLTPAPNSAHVPAGHLENDGGFHG